MGDFAPGDVVVCVDASPHGSEFSEVGPSLKAGACYRVADTHASRGIPHALLKEHVGFPTPDGTPWFWRASRFRKIRPADESFTRTVRECRPIREPVNA